MRGDNPKNQTIIYNLKRGQIYFKDHQTNVKRDSESKYNFKGITFFSRINTIHVSSMLVLFFFLRDVIYIYIYIYIQ